MNHTRGYYRYIRYKKSLQKNKIDNFINGKEFSTYKNLGQYSKNKICLITQNRGRKFKKHRLTRQEIRSENYMNDAIEEYFDNF